MEITFEASVDTELQRLEAAIAALTEAQRLLTPRIYTLLSQLNTLRAYRKTLALQETGEGEVKS